MNRSILAFGPHCDDVEFQFGSTLLKYHREQGYKIIYVEVTNNMSGAWMQKDGFPPLPDGDYPRESERRDEHTVHYTVPWFIEMPQRKKEAETAARQYFDADVIHLDYPQGAYHDENLREVTEGYGTPRPDCITGDRTPILSACKNPADVSRIRDLILQEDPEVVFSINVIDLNPEHSASAILALDGFMKAQRAGYKGSFLCPAPLNPTGFGYLSDVWDTFVDTTGYEAEKRRAIGVHACQMPHTDRLDLMDRLHGEICGCGEAEAYRIAYLNPEPAAPGTLTAELQRNAAYCETHFQEMFFSPHAKALFRAFWERIQYNF